MTRSSNRSSRLGFFTRNAVGFSSAEAFMIIAITTILLTRGYLWITDYPQVGGGNLHIAHALYGGAFMMLSLLISWWLLGFGARLFCVVLGGIGFGLFLDEVGKFVTKDNDYFYGPSAEIMYVLVVFVLIVGRVLREVRPLSAHEKVSSAASIAADGVARGLAPHRRELALRLVEEAEEMGYDKVAAEHIRSLLLTSGIASARLYTLSQWAPRLIPSWFRSPRWLPIVGWLMTVTAALAFGFGLLGVAMNGVYLDDDNVKFELAGMSMATAILLLSSTVTLAFSLPAMVMLRRTDKMWPLHFLRYGALTFTMLNALVDFATEGFAALVNLSVGLFTLAIISYRIDVRARVARPRAHEEALAASTPVRD
ncbi:MULTISPECIES: hypothetical protein [Actinomycetes]|uniref:hypothetical protein n=1 Tax=Actinomycetes TaxID=1760 RepID=UPI0004BF1746|nr:MULTISPECIES: hypothetical protein [Actinomycetes]